MDTLPIAYQILVPSGYSAFGFDVVLKETCCGRLAQWAARERLLASPENPALQQVQEFVRPSSGVE
jgi:hypothetical protein